MCPFQKKGFMGSSDIPGATWLTMERLHWGGERKQSHSHIPVLSSSPEREWGVKQMSQRALTLAGPGQWRLRHPASAFLAAQQWRLWECTPVAPTAKKLALLDSGPSWA
jgi:hypothetical protein